MVRSLLCTRGVCDWNLERKGPVSQVSMKLCGKTGEIWSSHVADNCTSRNPAFGKRLAVRPSGVMSFGRNATQSMPAHRPMCCIPAYSGRNASRHLALLHFGILGQERHPAPPIVQQQRPSRHEVRAQQAPARPQTTGKQSLVVSGLFHDFSQE